MSGALYSAELSDDNPELAPQCVGRQSVQLEGPATAVAFVPQLAETGAPWLVVQTREPPALVFVAHPNAVLGSVPLGGESVLDTGHELFHRDTGAGIACASCHLEGGDDGHVWNFDPIGPRRTQSLNVGLRGTEPFHWDGDMGGLEQIMSEVFVNRMQGARQTEERVAALANWVFALEPPAPITPATEPATVRGRALFESPEVGCSQCHSGPALTNNESYAVGTTEDGHALQVPSLVGIGHRAPYLHTGCAETLEERFDPSCGGGDQHGRTSHLDAEQIGDLVAYLETL